MSIGGVVYKDLLPIPDTDPTQHEGKSSTLRDAPTDSHALALEGARVPPTEEKGAAQIEHGEEVMDLGWNEPKEHVAKPLVGGLDNEDVWMLIRRFNRVRAIYLQFKALMLIFHSKYTRSRRFRQRLREAWI